ncbi:MAG: 1-deoxy-D-xylulose-5-phosphate synthase, partial [Phenylobacterium sp.]|nr:1-deoxy-D-xylulose-5-phosphate synthase [Phenylobacterium sp.]
GTGERVVAVTGDAAICSGMSWEALNHAGDAGTDLTVVLNDNRMSIAPNVGALTSYFTRLRSRPFLQSAAHQAKQVAEKLPAPMSRMAAGLRHGITHYFAPEQTGTIFEEMGFEYIGPVDGHDFPTLLEIFRNVRELRGPVFVHALTVKGKGYEVAELDARKWHGVVPFDLDKQEMIKAPGPVQYTQAFGDAAIECAERDDKVVAITAAMPDGTGLTGFAKRFPDRYHDVAIAEQHAVTFAAGLAADGMKPFCAIYSTFLQRGYDQVVHDVAIQGLPVRFAIDRAGLVGADGATHAGSFDVGYLGQLPGMVVMAPSDEAELAHAIATAVAIDDRPSAFRYPRGEGVGVQIPDLAAPLEIGRGRIVREGTAVAILSFGTRLAESLKAADLLAARGLSATVADARFAKPLDLDLLLRLAREHEALVTVEEGAVGGFGAFVLHALAEHGALDRGLKVRTLTLPDLFQDHDKPDVMYAQAGLDAEGIVRGALSALGVDNLSAKGRRA